jgi:hypothetical protein
VTKKFLLIAFAAAALGLSGWDNHETITRIAIAPLGLESVMTEAKGIEAFLETNKERLAAFLEALESRLREGLPYYPPRPDTLALDQGASGEALKASFLRALRMNPTLALPLYVELPPGVPHTDRPGLPTSAVDRFEWDFPNPPYESLAPGEAVSAMEVLTTASDEPDLSMDLGLFSDNDSPWGKEYGFGEQPYGNPRLEYGSQAPLHMAFPAEDPIIKAAAAFTGRSLVAMRVAQFTELARFAFSVGEEYWAYRFAGWAVHYIEDMEMPYHSSVMPGKGTFDLIWLNATGSEEQISGATTILSNRHLIYETFVYGVMKRWMPGSNGSPLYAALAEGPEAEPWRALYEYDVIARGAYSRGPALDALIVKAFPERYVADPAFDYGADKPDFDPYSAMGGPEGKALVDATAESFRALGSHVRAYLAYALEPTAKLPPRAEPFDARIVAYFLAPTFVIGALIALVVILLRRRKKARAA